MKEYGQWILCEERRPKETGEYLVRGTRRGITKTWKCQFCFLGEFGGWINNANNPIVSAWWESIDVAPKSEVAREIFEEIETALNLTKCYGDSGIYYEHDLEADIAELKKKYTECET